MQTCAVLVNYKNAALTVRCLHALERGTVKPDFVGTVLMTANKVVLNNVTVEPIEVQTVGNLSGGNTVYIGGII